MRQDQRHRAIQQRRAGDVGQVIADHDDLPRAPRCPQRRKRTADPPARDVKPDQIRMIRQQLFRHLLRDGGGFKGRDRLQQREVRRKLAEIRPEPGFVHLLIAVARVAHQDADLARRPADVGKRPGRGPAHLPVVQPDIVHLPRRRQLRDQRKDRRARSLDALDRVRHHRVHRRGQADRVAGPGQGQRMVGGVLRRQVVQKLDLQVDFGPRGAGRCRLQRVGDVLVERPVPLQQQHSEPQPGPRRMHAGLDAAQPVEPDRRGGLLHPFARAQPDVRRAGQDPVDGGDRDACGFGKVGDRRAAHRVGDLFRIIATPG